MSTATLASSVVGSALDRLVERAGDLKGELVAYGLERRWDRARAAAFEVAARSGADEEFDGIAAMDRFLLEHRLPDGRTVLERFVAARGDLPRAERDMLLGWRDVVEGMFEIEGRDGDALIAVNVVDELTYRIYATAGPKVFDPLLPGGVLVGRLVPLADAWLVTGAMVTYAAADADVLYPIAAEQAMRHPELCFRNPDKLALARAIEADHRRVFVEHFGADLVVLPGSQVRDRLNEFWRRLGGGEDLDSGWALGADYAGLGEARTVALIYDEHDGFGIYAEFGRLRETIADPALLAQPERREFVADYLHDPTVSPLPFRRLAARYPDGLDAALARVLKRPGFCWARDGETLMRRIKPEFVHPLPRTAPLGERLARYLRSG